MQIQKQYVKQCPYCNSAVSHVVFNRTVRRMVSECDDCGYSGTTIFKDIEKSLAMAQSLRMR